MSEALATQGVQVYFHFLSTTEHSNGGEKASRGHNSVLLPNDLAVPGEEDLVVRVERRGWALASSLGTLS